MDYNLFNIHKEKYKEKQDKLNFISFEPIENILEIQDPKRLYFLSKDQEMEGDQD